MSKIQDLKNTILYGCSPIFICMISRNFYTSFTLSVVLEHEVVNKTTGSLWHNIYQVETVRLTMVFLSVQFCLFKSNLSHSHWSETVCRSRYCTHKIFVGPGLTLYFVQKKFGQRVLHILIKLTNLLYLNHKSKLKWNRSTWDYIIDIY